MPIENLPAYPETFPSEAVRATIAHLRGEAPLEKEELVHCGWAVLSYVLGQVFPCEHPPMPMGSEECSNDDCAGHLEEWCDDCEDCDGEKGMMEKCHTSYPWKLIVPVLFDLVRDEVLKHL